MSTKSLLKLLFPKLLGLMQPHDDLLRPEGGTIHRLHGAGRLVW